MFEESLQQTSNRNLEDGFLSNVTYSAGKTWTFILGVATFLPWISGITFKSKIFFTIFFVIVFIAIFTFSLWHKAERYKSLVNNLNKTIYNCNAKEAELLKNNNELKKKFVAYRRAYRESDKLLSNICTLCDDFKTKNVINESSKNIQKDLFKELED